MLIFLFIKMWLLQTAFLVFLFNFGSSSELQKQSNDLCPPINVGRSNVVCYYEGKKPVNELYVCGCTHLVYTGNAKSQDLEELSKALLKKQPKMKFILRVTGKEKNLDDFLDSHHCHGVEIQNAHHELDRTRVTNNIKAVRSTVGTGTHSIVMLSLPGASELLAKYYDMKVLQKYVDLFILETYGMEDIHNVTSHPSRLSGLWDMMNIDSTVDLVVGLGVPEEKIVVMSPAHAYVFTLSNKILNTPGSTTVGRPQILNQEKFCNTIKDGNWTLERDQDLSAPYTFNGNKWIAFEDVSSLDVKSKYARVRGLAGHGLIPLDDDDENTCEGRLLGHVVKSLSTHLRAPRRAVLGSLKNEILAAPQSQFWTDSVQLSPYRITRVVDSDGIVHAIREDIRTEFECQRQGYFVHPRSCNRFYRCVKFDQQSDEFTVFEFDCPSGLEFDSRYEVCVWPGSLDKGQACPGSSEIAPVPQTRFICPQKEGYYADPENCRWFFACLDHGKQVLTAYEFRCPFGLGFDENRLICDWPWQIPGCGNVGRYEAVLYDHGHNRNAVILNGPSAFIGSTADAINTAGYENLLSGAKYDNLIGIQTVAQTNNAGLPTAGGEQYSLYTSNLQQPSGYKAFINPEERVQGSGQTSFGVNGITYGNMNSQDVYKYANINGNGGQGQSISQNVQYQNPGSSFKYQENKYNPTGYAPNIVTGERQHTLIGQYPVSEFDQRGQTVPKYTQNYATQYNTKTFSTSGITPNTANTANEYITYSTPQPYDNPVNKFNLTGYTSNIASGENTHMFIGEYPVYELNENSQIVPKYTQKQTTQYDTTAFANSGNIGNIANYGKTVKEYSTYNTPQVYVQSTALPPVQTSITLSPKAKEYETVTTGSTVVLPTLPSQQYVTPYYETDSVNGGNIYFGSVKPPVSTSNKLNYYSKPQEQSYSIKYSEISKPELLTGALVSGLVGQTKTVSVGDLQNESQKSSYNVESSVGNTQPNGKYSGYFSQSDFAVPQLSFPTQQTNVKYTQQPYSAPTAYSSVSTSKQSSISPPLSTYTYDQSQPTGFSELPFNYHQVDTQYVSQKPHIYPGQPAVSGPSVSYVSEVKQNIPTSISYTQNKYQLPQEKSREIQYTVVPTPATVVQHVTPIIVNEPALNTASIKTISTTEAIPYESQTYVLPNTPKTTYPNYQPPQVTPAPVQNTQVNYDLLQYPELGGIPVVHINDFNPFNSAPQKSKTQVLSIPSATKSDIDKISGISNQNIKIYPNGNNYNPSTSSSSFDTFSAKATKDSNQYISKSYNSYPSQSSQKISTTNNNYKLTQTQNTNGGFGNYQFDLNGLNKPETNYNINLEQYKGQTANYNTNTPGKIFNAYDIYYGQTDSDALKKSNTQSAIEYNIRYPNLSSAKNTNNNYNPLIDQLNADLQNSNKKTVSTSNINYDSLIKQLDTDLKNYKIKPISTNDKTDIYPNQENLSSKLKTGSVSYNYQIGGNANNGFDINKYKIQGYTYNDAGNSNYQTKVKTNTDFDTYQYQTNGKTSTATNTNKGNTNAYNVQLKVPTGSSNEYIGYKPSNGLDIYSTSQTYTVNNINQPKGTIFNEKNGAEGSSILDNLNIELVKENSKSQKGKTGKTITIVGDGKSSDTTSQTHRVRGQISFDGHVKITMHKNVKPKFNIVTKVNDYNPLIVTKLRAQCSCSKKRRLFGLRTLNNAPTEVQETDYNEYEDEEASNDYSEENDSYTNEATNDTTIIRKSKIIVSSTLSPIIVEDDIEVSNAAPTAYNTKPIIVGERKLNIKKTQEKDDGTPTKGTECKREGLFRHPKDCNKFYSCSWDSFKNKYILHEFRCPIQLSFDHEMGACNWPSQGPACQSNTLLPSIY